MISFSHFLIGMGYPEASIRNPDDGTWTFSCYENSKMIAGMIAWYYEQEGMRPMIVGHSQGGFQYVRVLDDLAYSKQLDVWNPLTWKKENRTEIIDPLTGKKRPVAGLTLPYVTSMGAGGLTRCCQTQWDMNFRLRSIPDTVEEFTGFYKGRDRWAVISGATVRRTFSKPPAPPWSGIFNCRRNGNTAWFPTRNTCC